MSRSRSLRRHGPQGYEGYIKRATQGGHIFDVIGAIGVEVGVV